MADSEPTLHGTQDGGLHHTLGSSKLQLGSYADLVFVKQSVVSHLRTSAAALLGVDVGALDAPTEAALRAVR